MNKLFDKLLDKVYLILIDLGGFTLIFLGIQQIKELDGSETFGDLLDWPLSNSFLNTQIILQTTIIELSGGKISDDGIHSVLDF